MLRFCLFDLDGTLFDTRPAMSRCGNAGLAKIGLPPFPMERYAQFSGGGVEEFVGAILRAAGDTECRHFDEFWQAYLEEQNRDPEAGNRPYDGIPELLDRLREMGISTGVLSNKDDASCIKIVEKTFGKDAFTVIRGNRENTPPKPDPAGAFAILNEFQIKPEECLYLGDTETDMKTGKNASLFTVAALWGYRGREELEAFSPDAVAENPLDVLNFFK